MGVIRAYILSQKKGIFSFVLSVWEKGVKSVLLIFIQTFFVGIGSEFGH
jgi:hypothetical protein